MKKLAKEQVSSLVTASQALRDFDEKHAEVLARREALVKALAKEEAKVKKAARAMAPPKGKVVLWNDGGVEVSVTFRSPSVTYGFDEAQRAWSGKAVTYCAKIDSKRVEEALKEGILTEDEAKKAVIGTKATTPAVAFKYVK